MGEGGGRGMGEGGGGGMRGVVSARGKLKCTSVRKLTV